MIPSHVRKILLVRLSARGDLVFASPLARALRRRFPDAHISWLAEESAADVISNNPHIDEVIVWQRGAWRRLLRERRFRALGKAVKEFIGDLRSRRFDVAIDTQGLLRSGVLTFLSGAGRRIGLGSKEGSKIFMTEVVPRGGNSREIGSEYRFLAQELGLPADDFPIAIPRSEKEHAFVAEVIASEGLEDGFVIACPFTTRHYKHWFEDRWSELLTRISTVLDLPVVLLGGPEDRSAAERILAGVGAGRVIDLVGRTKLGEASAMVAHGKLLIGVDTGLSHMAHGYGRPTVLIFGSNTPYLDPPLPTSSILWAGLACAPCRGRLTCGGAIDCMVAITVEEVFEAVRAGLEMAPDLELTLASSRAVAPGTRAS